MFIYKMVENANIFRFTQPIDVASWAVSGGGLQSGIRTVVNRSLGKKESIGDKPFQWLKFTKKVQREVGDSAAVVLFTSVPSVACKSFCLRSDANNMQVDTFVTVGLGNRFSPGDKIWEIDSVKSGGTINIVCIINRCLTEGACLEAIHSITLAKAYSLVKSGLLSSHSKNGPAIATPTDGIAVCSLSDHQEKNGLAGVQQELGYLIIASVMGAMDVGISCWKNQQDKIGRLK